MTGPPTTRARDLAAAVRSGAASAVEICERALEAAETTGRRLGAFTAVLRDEALAEAARVDTRRAAGVDPGPLAGVPVAVKDNLSTRGAPTTCASRVLAGWVPPYDATVVARLRAAGAVLIGKTNMDEFAMGSSTENSAFEPCRNPWDPDRVPGGSSGGSACAVASGIVPGALGSDTGGSVRQPAAFCGVVGVKPTYGRVSRYGLVAFASSLDQVGVLAGDVADAALLLRTIAGHDPADSTSAPLPVDEDLADPAPGFPADPRAGFEGVTFGWPEECFAAGLDPDVDAAVRGVLSSLEGAGARVRPVSLPHTASAIPTYYLIATAEASSNLARYDGVRYGLRVPAGRLDAMYRGTRSAGFGAEVKRRILLGTYALSSGYYDAYYLQAQKARTLLRRDFERAFRKVDVLLTPTTPTAAFRLGEKSGDPLQMYLSDIFTVTANLAGVPAVSIPCGLTGTGLPIGLQLIGDLFQETRLLRAASGIESLLGLSLRPGLHA